jgi:hypothetical protein
MNRYILFSFALLFSLLQHNAFALNSSVDSVTLGYPEKVECDSFNEFNLSNGYYFGTPLNPFAPSNLYTVYFYLPAKTSVNFNWYDTNNVMICRIKSFELEKGFYKTRFELFTHENGIFDLEMGTRLFKGKLRFYSIH